MSAAPARTAPVQQASTVRTLQEDELLDAVMRDTSTSVGYRLERLFKVLSVAEGRASRAAPVQQDKIGRKAFARYIKDCDECAIVPDVAGAFHWAWTHAAPVQPLDAWCCEKGQAAGKEVCDECAAESLAYSAAMGVQPDDTPLETGEGDAR